MTKTKEITLPAIHANVGIARQFQKELDALIDEMHRSIVYWVGAAYKANKPATMATDASSASILNDIVARLTSRWTRKFRESSKPMADYYARQAKDRTDASLKAALKKSGFTIDFVVTPAIQDIITASVNNNVASIKSIPAEYLNKVAQSVQRSVQAGRDLGGLVKELQDTYGVTKRRASLIAHMSNNQASAMIERQRA